MSQRKGGKRDYAAEYKRRIDRAKRLGYSKNVARGHPGKGEIGIRRAKRMLLPGPTVISRTYRETRRGYRPTFAEIRARLQSLNLKFLAETIKGRRGRIPIAWTGPKGDRYLKDDPDRDAFIEGLTAWGMTDHEAYTLWFSP